jgi:adenine phosphoribosyltransferase
MPAEPAEATGLDGLAGYVRDIPDFPKPGVTFKDITPLLGDHDQLRVAVDALAAPYADERVSKVVGIEARGFILAAPVALRLGAGFVPVRKAGKLPWHIERITYDLEYGTDTLEVHQGAVEPGERVLVVDDVLATGGTAEATAELVERLGGTVVGLAFLIELAFLGGGARLGHHAHTSLLSY